MNNIIINNMFNINDLVNKFGSNKFIHLLVCVIIADEHSIFVNNKVFNH